MSEYIFIIVLVAIFILANIIVSTVRKVFMKLIGANIMFFNTKTHFALVLFLTIIIAGSIVQLIEPDNQSNQKEQVFYEVSESGIGTKDEELDIVSEDNNLEQRNDTEDIQSNSKEVKERVQFDYINVTSQLYEEGYNYDAENLVDGNLETIWVEGVDGYGEGETIHIFSNEGKKYVSQINIYNGFAKTDDLYKKNSRVKGLMIQFEDGTVVYEELQDSKDVQTIYLDEIVETGWIKLTVISTYPGTKYEDTCLTEIEIY